MKKLIKKVLGEKNWNQFVAYVKYAKTLFYFSNKPKIELSKGYHYKLINIPGKHVFFGYYDIQQFDKDQTNLLVHVVDRRAKTAVDSAELGIYNIENNKYTKITDTHAWCWQQGSRLRWLPNNKGYVVFNNVADGKYVSQVWRVGKENTFVKQIDAALYDFNHDFSYGLSLNFSRLQRLRPGYGYDSLHDDTIDLNAPENDGIFFVDIKNNISKLIVRLSDLAKKVDPENQLEHYINHISFSPDGSHFLFFHIWNTQIQNRWRTRLYVSDLEGNLVLLEDKDIVSHYDWKDNQSIIVTCITSDKKQYYAIYDYLAQSKMVLEDPHLCKDGHPTFFYDSDTIISDTYPMEHCQQRIFTYCISSAKYLEVAKLYSSPLLYGEKRCDLHPRLSSSGKYITVDSTCKNNVRNVMVIWRRSE